MTEQLRDQLLAAPKPIHQVELIDDIPDFPNWQLTILVVVLAYVIGAAIILSTLDFQ